MPIFKNDKTKIYFYLQSFYKKIQEINFTKFFLEIQIIP
jgi:hypothetical protein